MPEMTERQARDWPGAVAELNRAIESDGYISLDGGHWEFVFEDETRPGRWHLLDARWNDGEYFAQVRMDVYGSYTASIASLNWIHTPAEECDCPSCEADRVEDEVEEEPRCEASCAHGSRCSLTQDHAGAHSVDHYRTGEVLCTWEGA